MEEPERVAGIRIERRARIGEVVSTTGVIISCEGEARVSEGTGVPGNHHYPEKGWKKRLRFEEVGVVSNIGR